MAIASRNDQLGRPMAEMLGGSDRIHHERVFSEERGVSQRGSVVTALGVQRSSRNIAKLSSFNSGESMYFNG